MNMAERRALAAQKLAALVPAPAAPAKPRIRVYAGQLVTEAMLKIALGIETVAQKFARWAEEKAEEHKAGGTCPHCKGTGRYNLHTQPGSNGKCYRCDGKGVLNIKDLAFMNSRIKKDAPLCWITTA